METSVYIHTLTFIILLRVANVKLAPLFARWKDLSLQHVFELHEILCLHHHGDVLAAITVKILAPEYDFDSLTRGLPVVKADWYRFVRRNIPIPAAVSRAADELTRKFRGARQPSFGHDTYFEWTKQCVLMLHDLHTHDSDSTSVAVTENMEVQIMETSPLVQATCPRKDEAAACFESRRVAMMFLDTAGDAEAMTAGDAEGLSRASSESNLSSVAGDESPPHLRQKFDLYPSCEEDFHRFRTLYIHVSCLCSVFWFQW